MKPIIQSILASLFLTSCGNLMDPGLKSQAEVIQAKSVAICQSPDLNQATISGDQGLTAILLERNRSVSLPNNSTAKAIAAALPAGMKAVLTSGMEKPEMPANRAAKPFRSSSHPSFYNSVKPVKDCDLIIYVCETMPTSSMGYYNSAAGIYVPGAEGGSGYSGSRDPFLRKYNYAALLDVYVYRGSDGRCLGTFYLPFGQLSKQRDPEAGFQDLVANTGSVIIQKIFGRSR